jgi:hypothetical protein
MLKKFVPSRRVVDSIERPLKIYCDNESVVLYAHNNKEKGCQAHQYQVLCCERENPGIDH